MNINNSKFILNENPSYTFVNVYTLQNAFPVVARQVAVNMARRTRASLSHTSVRPQVSASLERSIIENSDVWAKLAKH